MCEGAGEVLKSAKIRTSSNYSEVGKERREVKEWLFESIPKSKVREVWGKGFDFRNCGKLFCFNSEGSDGRGQVVK